MYSQAKTDSFETQALNSFMTFKNNTHRSVVTRSAALAVIILRDRYPEMVAVFQEEKEANPKDSVSTKALLKKKKTAKETVRDTIKDMQKHVDILQMREAEIIREKKLEEAEEKHAIEATLQRKAALLEVIHFHEKLISEPFHEEHDKVTLYLPMTSTVSQEPVQYADVSLNFPLEEVFVLVWKALNDDSVYAPGQSPYSDAVKKQRLERISSFFYQIEYVASDMICHHGQRNTYLLALNKSFPGIHIITDERFLILEMHREYFEKHLMPFYQNLHSEEERIQLSQALILCLQEKNAAKLFSIIDPEDSILKNVKEALLKHGTNPAIEDVSAAYVACVRGYTLPEEMKGLASLTMVSALLRTSVEEEKSELSQALVSVQGLLTTRDLLSIPKREIEDTFLLFESHTLWQKYENAMRVLGLMNPELENLPKCIEGGLQSIIANKTLLSFSEEDRKIIALLKPRPEKINKTQLHDSIQDFFSMWYAAQEENLWIELHRLYLLLIEPSTDKLIKVSDEEIQKYMIDNQNADDQHIMIDVYMINRIFLHAIMNFPEQWTEKFSFVFSVVLEFVKNDFNLLPLDAPTKTNPMLFHFSRKAFGVENLKQKSYPESLLAQLRYLQFLRKRSTGEILDIPVEKPVYDFVMPSQANNVKDWLYIVYLGGLSNLKIYFYAYAKKILDEFKENILTGKITNQSSPGTRFIFHYIPEEYHLDMIKLLEIHNLFARKKCWAFHFASPKTLISWLENPEVVEYICQFYLDPLEAYPYFEQAMNKAIQSIADPEKKENVLRLTKQYEQYIGDNAEEDFIAQMLAEIAKGNKDKIRDLIVRRYTHFPLERKINFEEKSLEPFYQILTENEKREFDRDYQQLQDQLIVKAFFTKAMHNINSVSVKTKFLNRDFQVRVFLDDDALARIQSINDVYLWPILFQALAYPRRVWSEAFQTKLDEALSYCHQMYGDFLLGDSGCPFAQAIQEIKGERELSGRLIDTFIFPHAITPKGGVSQFIEAVRPEDEDYYFRQNPHLMDMILQSNLFEKILMKLSPKRLLLTLRQLDAEKIQSLYYYIAASCSDLRLLTFMMQQGFYPCIEFNLGMKESLTKLINQEVMKMKEERLPILQLGMRIYPNLRNIILQIHIFQEQGNYRAVLDLVETHLDLFKLSIADIRTEYDYHHKQKKVSNDSNKEINNQETEDESDNESEDDSLEEEKIESKNEKAAIVSEENRGSPEFQSLEGFFQMVLLRANFPLSTLEFFHLSDPEWKRLPDMIEAHVKEMYRQNRVFPLKEAEAALFSRYLQKINILEKDYHYWLIQHLLPMEETNECKKAYDQLYALQKNPAQRIFFQLHSEALRRIQEKGFLDSYLYKRVILHALIEPPENWDPLFPQLLSQIFDLLKMFHYYPIDQENPDTMEYYQEILDALDYLLHPEQFQSVPPFPVISLHEPLRAYREFSILEAHLSEKELKKYCSKWKESLQSLLYESMKMGKITLSELIMRWKAFDIPILPLLKQIKADLGREPWPFEIAPDLLSSFIYQEPKAIEYLQGFSQAEKRSLYPAHADIEELLKKKFQRDSLFQFILFATPRQNAKALEIFSQREMGEAIFRLIPYSDGYVLLDNNKLALLLNDSRYLAAWRHLMKRSGLHYLLLKNLKEKKYEDLLDLFYPVQTKCQDYLLEDEDLANWNDFSEAGIHQLFLHAVFLPHLSGSPLFASTLQTAFTHPMSEELKQIGQQIQLEMQDPKKDCSPDKRVLLLPHQVKTIEHLQIVLSHSNADRVFKFESLHQKVIQPLRQQYIEQTERNFEQLLISSAEHPALFLRRLSNEHFHHVIAALISKPLDASEYLCIFGLEAHGLFGQALNEQERVLIAKGFLRLSSQEDSLPERKRYLIQSLLYFKNYRTALFYLQALIEEGKNNRDQLEHKIETWTIPEDKDRDEADVVLEAHVLFNLAFLGLDSPKVFEFGKSNFLKVLQISLRAYSAKAENTQNPIDYLPQYLKDAHERIMHVFVDHPDFLMDFLSLIYPQKFVFESIMEIFRAQDVEWIMLQSSPRLKQYCQTLDLEKYPEMKEIIRAFEKNTQAETKLEVSQKLVQSVQSQGLLGLGIFHQDLPILKHRISFDEKTPHAISSEGVLAYALSENRIVMINPWLSEESTILNLASEKIRSLQFLPSGDLTCIYRHENEDWIVVYQYKTLQALLKINFPKHDLDGISMFQESPEKYYFVIPSPQHISYKNTCVILLRESGKVKKIGSLHAENVEAFFILNNKTFFAVSELYLSKEKHRLFYLNEKEMMSETKTEEVHGKMIFFHNGNYLKVAKDSNLAMEYKSSLSYYDHNLGKLRTFDLGVSTLLQERLLALNLDHFAVINPIKHRADIYNLASQKIQSFSTQDLSAPLVHSLCCHWLHTHPQEKLKLEEKSFSK